MPILSFNGSVAIPIATIITNLHRLMDKHKYTGSHTTDRYVYSILRPDHYTKQSDSYAWVFNKQQAL